MADHQFFEFQVVLKALRAGPEAEGPVETRNDATDGVSNGDVLYGRFCIAQLLA